MVILDYGQYIQYAEGGYIHVRKTAEATFMVPSMLVLDRKKIQTFGLRKEDRLFCSFHFIPFQLAFTTTKTVV